MPTSPRQIPFRVDVAGVIEIMGTSLYSRPDMAIRELIQNAHDAILRRRERDLSYRGRIDIVQDAAERRLQIHDDGVGLSAAEAEEYLCTLGVGMTRLIKQGLQGHTPASGLIGQFGVGLFSAFMLADTVIVESRRFDGDMGIRWEAGAGPITLLSDIDRGEAGTSVTLCLKADHAALAENEELLDAAIKQYADFLPVPIHLNHGKSRSNVINVAWFEPTPEQGSVELELEGYFSETPLDVIPIRVENPTAIAGALYVTPQRTPGFAGDPVLTVTVRRMVVSRNIQGLLPPWGSFVRGVLELSECAPTTSREDLVRNLKFEQIRRVLEQKLYEHFERLATEDPARWESLLAWHRYTWAGAALNERRLRDLLRRTYRLPTSQGSLTFDEILAKSLADPLFENEAERVIWYNSDRRQEGWVNAVFTGHDVPCVHALRSFEEALLAAWAADTSAEGTLTDVRTASPGSPNFAEQVLGIRDLEEAPPEWQEFLSAIGAQVLCASFRSQQPVMAFLNERYELLTTFEELKKRSSIPAGFQRLIDAHFEDSPTGRNEVLLNRNHRLVGRALEQKTTSPLASVLRLLVHNALTAAGAALPRAILDQQTEDLDWIAEALWGRSK